MMNTLKPILVIFLFFVGAASAAPISLEAKSEADTRLEYTSALNAMATNMMNWYGSLISKSNAIQFNAPPARWDMYRADYPQQITQIEITNTDLTKTEVSDQYQFAVDTLITYKNDAGVHRQKRQETILFQAPLLATAVIKDIINEKTTEIPAKQTITTDPPTFDRMHYKAREFAYAWLAYLDGVSGQEALEKQLSKAIYEFKIGSNRVQDSVASTRLLRAQYLTQGGHLLRTLNVKESENKPDHFILDLIIEWKGVNQSGKPVLAKIHQEIEYQIQENGEWQINIIKEEHLLPDIAPWSGLLC